MYKAASKRVAGEASVLGIGEPQPLLVSVPETARLLGIGERMVWDLLQKEHLRTIKIGRRTLVPRADVERLAGR
jgi:excisionase family DNA binding protein